MPDAQSTLALADLLIKGGAAASLVLVLIIGYKRYWVYGPELVEERAESEKRFLEMQATLNRHIFYLQERLTEREEQYQQLVDRLTDTPKREQAVNE